MTALLAWFTATSIGKTLLKWSGIAALLVAGYWRLYASAKADVEAKHVAEDLQKLREKEDLNETVRKMDGASVDRELARWVRD
ncbi:hypothetical protein [Allorhizobium borbori]|uniref:Uncharacterized protein n=1 Tax=Allorhizobium borbori TaxID=485907 RepID=A0A7W6P0G2_9HYPH|nr:hypothetical protein [Allorhizobium borbori]MBB4102413.1 hypothetical protein [Allorhizobium borbori]